MTDTPMSVRDMPWDALFRAADEGNSDAPAVFVYAFLVVNCGSVVLQQRDRPWAAIGLFGGQVNLHGAPHGERRVQKGHAVPRWIKRELNRELHEELGMEFASDDDDGDDVVVCVRQTGKKDWRQFSLCFYIALDASWGDVLGNFSHAQDTLADDAKKRETIGILHVNASMMRSWERTETRLRLHKPHLYLLRKMVAVQVACA